MGTRGGQRRPQEPTISVHWRRRYLVCALITDEHIWNRLWRGKQNVWDDISVPERWSAHKWIWDLIVFVPLTVSLMILSKKISLWAKKSNTKYWWTKKRGGKTIKWNEMDWEALWAQSWLPAVYLIVKRSVGPFFNRSLFLLISDLNNHAGVNVFPNQLPGFCDVNGNLWNKVKISSQLHVFNDINFNNHAYFYLKALWFPFNVLDAGLQLGPEKVSLFVSSLYSGQYSTQSSLWTFFLHLLLFGMTLVSSAETPGWSSGVSSSSSGDASGGAAASLSTEKQI